MRVLLGSALLVSIASAAWLDAPPSSVLIVSVGEVGTGAYVPDAQVSLTSLKKSARTKWDGEARFSGLAPGRVHVQVRAIGFAPGDIDLQIAGDSMEIHFELERTAVGLDTVM